MTRSQNHQLSLSDSRCDCAPLSADKVAAAAPRILIVFPGSCPAQHRDDIAGELGDVLKGHGYQTEAISLEDSPESGRGSAPGKPTNPGILRRIAYFKGLSRRLAAFDICHLICYPGLSFMRGILPAVLLAKFFGKKVVLDYRTPIIFKPSALERFFVERVWRLCDRVLVLSTYQQQLVSSFGGASEYIRAGVELERITPRVIKNLQPRIMVAADLEREHNVTSAIRAFKLVKQKYPRTEMTIIGAGGEESALRDIVEGEKIHGITFAGAVSGRKRTELLEGGDLYLNCSSVDFVSAATAEAFAHGLPVLTTPLTGIGEVLRSRENIILLPYNDHVGAAERIIELVENPELTEKLSRNAGKTGAHYGSSQRRDEWLRLYRCLSRVRD